MCVFHQDGKKRLDYDDYYDALLYIALAVNWSITLLIIITQLVREFLLVASYGSESTVKCIICICVPC